MTYIDALKQALTEEMAANTKIVALGQDLRTWGGSGGLFKGLSETYPDRILDTPISESASVGIAVGMAMNGLRPIVEFTFMDFLLHGLDPLINEAAKIRTISGGQFSAPVIIRAVINSARGYGATHSQSFEALCFNIPELTIVYPALAGDAYGLLKSAFQSQTPVLFVEHKLLHNKVSPFEPNTVPIGKASVLKQGDQATLVSFGRMSGIAESVGEQMNGIEVIDLRTVSPLDYDTIITSVKKTGKLVLLEEGYGTITAEIAATVTQRAFESLKAPIVRIHSKRTVIPVRKDLEDALFPTEDRVLSVLMQLTTEE